MNEHLLDHYWRIHPDEPTMTPEQFAVAKAHFDNLIADYRTSHEGKYPSLAEVLEFPLAEVVK